MYLFRQPDVDQGPDEEVTEQNPVDVEVAYQQKVGHGENEGDHDDGNHGRALLHADGQQFVVNVVLVREERVAAVAYPVQIDSHYVAAGYEQGREEADHQVGFVVPAFGRGQRQELEAEDGKHHADREAARIAHEYFPLLFGVAEYIIIIERYEHSQGGKGKHGIDILATMVEHGAVGQQGDAAKTGCQAVDAVDEVDGIDEKDYGKHRQRVADEGGKGVNAQNAVQVVDRKACGNQHQTAKDLDDELGTVADADEVVGHAGEVEDHDGTESERQGTDVLLDLGDDLVMSQQQVDA